jgi:hypothetical protein
MQAHETEFWIASERNGEYPFTREDSFERKLRRHCEQYLNGWTLQEIGRQLGVTKQAAAKTLKFALIKLKQAWRTNPFYGLAEVYRSETRRVGSKR